MKNSFNILALNLEGRDNLGYPDVDMEIILT
jgi:hypothetical protein